MHLIVCVDEDLGMLFNHRRQSQDRELRKRILEITSGKKLWMNHYSQKQFEKENAVNIYSDDNFLSKAAIEDYCFVETDNITPYEPYIKNIILYKWNRQYPSDMKLNIDLTHWKLQSTIDFSGSSHEKITEEVYIYNEKFFFKNN